MSTWLERHPEEHDEMRKHPGRKWRVRAERAGAVVNLQDAGDFDEVAVGDWLHVEQMEARRWWMRVGERTFSIYIPRSTKKPIRVTETT